MELLTTLDLGATNDFFRAFFALPPFYWRGFLGSNLSSVQLLAFAFLVFWLAPVNIKAKLVSHLALGEFDRGVDQGRGGGGLPTTATSCAAGPAAVYCGQSATG
jgi:lycopene epsilon-cyclase